MTTTEWVLLAWAATATVLAGLGWIAFYGSQDQVDDANENCRRFYADLCRYEGLYRDKAAEHAALSGVVDAATVRAAHDALRDTPAFFAAKVLSEDERAWDSEVFGG